MATKGNEALRELCHITECCICLMPFTDPRTLSCFHSACLKCFEDIQAKNNKKPGDVIPCPVCRKEFPIPSTGMSGLQKNFFIANLLEITQKLNEEDTPQSCKMCKIIDAQKDANEVTMKCLECREAFCERCANVHTYSKLTQGHRVVEVKENLSEEEILMVLPPANCPNHPLQVLNYYCGDCKAVVCVSCFVETHTSHSCKDVTTVDKDFRRDIESSSSQMPHYISQMEAEKSKMENKKKDFLQQISGIENAIQHQNQQLKAMIDQHTQVVLNELSSMKQKHLKNIEAEIEEAERQMTNLQSFETFCFKIKSKGSPTDVCSCADELLRRADELKKENDKYLRRPDCVVQVTFNATDQNVLLRSYSNVIGKIEELTKKLKRYAIVIGLSDWRFVDVTKINLHRSADICPLKKMPIGMQNEVASAVYCNSIYITGLGNKSNEIWNFDAVSDKWKKCASMVKGRRRHSVAFIDQLLYMCGGYAHSDKSTLDDVEAYDVINNRCSSVGKLVHCVRNSSNCVPFNSSLYIFGGANAYNKVMNHVQVYNTASNICTLLSNSMPRSYSHMRAVLLEQIFVLLGRDNCFLYDLDTGVWQERRQFKTDVSYFGMIIENGQIFVIGGAVDEIDAYGKSNRTLRDDVKCIPVKNIIKDEAIEWEHHAKLSRSSLIFVCEKIHFEA